MDLGKKYYKVSTPFQTHWRQAWCREVGCKDYMMGWETILSTAEHQDLIEIVRRSGMEFTERQEGPLTVFRFPPGQECFRSRINPGTHKKKLDRDPFFKIDGNVIEFNRWIDDFQENQYQIGRRREVSNG